MRNKNLIACLTKNLTKRYTSSVPDANCTIKEGKALINLPATNSVFYNKSQVFNRDLSIVIVRTFLARLRKERELEHKNNQDAVPNESERAPLEKNGQYPTTLFEAFSASGLRAIRYSKEVAGLDTVIANDLSSHAVENIRKNVTDNGIPEGRVLPSEGEANFVMLSAKNKSIFYDIVDLDPYGSVVSFLDCAVQSVADDGLLLATCTDMAVLCGDRTDSCYAKYGSMPLRQGYDREQATRIILHNIERAANRWGKYIEPLVSVSIDFYVRVAVRLRRSKQIANSSPSKQSMIFGCLKCGSYVTSPLATLVTSGERVRTKAALSPPVGISCAHCGGSNKMGGPIYNAAIHDKAFVDEMLKSLSVDYGGLAMATRLEECLCMIQQELPLPLCFDIPSLCSVLHVIEPPTTKLRQAFVRAGYQVSMTHTSITGLKTNAPFDVIWDVLRSWVKIAAKIHRSERSIPENSAGAQILAKEPASKADFGTYRFPAGRGDARVRKNFFKSPEPYW